MALKHITGHVYAHCDDIRKVEGFPLTLLIKVTLADGSVHERFVPEQRIEWWTTEEGLRKRADEWQKSMAGVLERRHRLPQYAGCLHTREEAFGYELSYFLRGLNK